MPKPKTEIEAILAQTTTAKRRLSKSVGEFAMAFVELEAQANYAIGIFLQIPNSKLTGLMTAAIISVKLTKSYDDWRAKAGARKASPVKRP